MHLWLVLPSKHIQTYALLTTPSPPLLPNNHHLSAGLVPQPPHWPPCFQPCPSAQGGAEGFFKNLTHTLSFLYSKPSWLPLQSKSQLSYYSPLRLLCSFHTSCLLVLQTHQANCCLSPFALAIPFVLPLDSCSSTSFKSL